MKSTVAQLGRAALSLALAGGLHAKARGARLETPDSATDRLFKDCEPAPAFGGTFFRCDAFMAGVSEAEGMPPRQVAEMVLAGIQAATGETLEVTTAMTPFEAEGKQWPGFRVALRRPGEPANGLEGHVLVFESSPGIARIALCVAPPRQPGAVQRCQQLLPLLAEKGPAPFRLPSGEPTFLGTALAIPPGCETLDSTDRGFRVQCGETAMLMSMRLRKVEEIPRIVNLASEQLVRQFPGAEKTEDRDCQVGGTAVRCRTIHHGEGRSRVVVYVGGAEVGNVPVVVICGQLADQKGVHPLCANAMTF